MAVATLSTARIIRRPRRADPRALIGVCLTLAALAGSVAFWVSATDTRAVLIATHDLPAGATLRSSDLATAYLRMDDGVYHAAWPADMLESLVGRRVGEPMHTDQVLVRGQIVDKYGLAADQVAITLPARPENAVDGRLRPGDAVQVLVTVVDKARNEAHARQVLERAQVFAVGRDTTLSSSSSSTGADSGEPSRGAITSVTLAVSPDQARQLAEARRSGELDILLLPPQERPRS